MKKMLRDAEYVRLYDADGELVATIKDGEEIGGIWIAMDLWNREHVACCSEGDDVGQLTYPTEMELDGQRFHFPIRLHSDGIALWGITPDSRHWFRSSQLTAHVQQLLATYTAVDAATE